MSATATAVVKSNVSGTYTGNDFIPSFQPAFQFQRTYSSQDVTKIYWATLSVTSTPTVLNVQSLTDADGNALSFSTVLHVQIVNNDTTNALTAGGGTNPLFAALPTLAGTAQTNGGGNTGSAINLTTALTVNGTAKNISLTASAGTITVDVFLAGN